MLRVGLDTVDKLQDYIAGGIAMYGRPVTYRKYISASAGNPDVGISDKLYYQERPTTCEMRLLSIEEVQMMGGQVPQGTFEVYSLESIDSRDEFIYNGEAYRIVSQPEQEVVGRRLYSRAFIARASVTGYFG